MIDKNSGVGTSDWPAAVVYSRTGPLDSVLRGRETWQDLTDSGELVEWELWDQCSAQIETPKVFDELVYDDKIPGVILRKAKADVQPTFWEQDLHWKFKEVNGSEVEPPPIRANGNDFDLTYTKLPSKNSSFGEWLLEAEFATDRARKAGCKNPKPHPISYHFPREETNNPGPGAKPDDGKDKKLDANWFYYWGQTAAAQRRYPELRYGGAVRRCSERIETKPRVKGREINISGLDETPLFGFAPWGKPYVVICDLSKLDFSDRHLFTGRPTNGIDTYAITVVHELKHHDDQRKWFPGGHDPTRDTDIDGIPDDMEGDPDLVEQKVEVPAPLNTKHKYFKPGEFDTLKRGIGDEHYLAYMAEMEWAPGKADHEDWACPGHQATTECSKPQ